MREYTGPDFILLSIVLALLGIGIVMVYSSSAFLTMGSSGSEHFLNESLKRGGLGIFALLLGSAISHRFWRKIAKPGILISIFLLILVLVVGERVQGAKRWLFSSSFQPSELAKFALIVYLSDSLDRKQWLIRRFKQGILPNLIVINFIALLVALEPNIGTAVMIVLISYFLLFLSEVRLDHFVLIFCFTIFVFFIIAMNFTYSRLRIFNFLNGIENQSVQVKQSLIGLGSGGVFGVGLGESRQKFLFIPTPHTDFIFAIIGEELGIFGSSGVLLLFIIFGIRAIGIAERAVDTYSRLIASGITLSVLLQAIVNIGVVIGVLPTSGLPLPFISFGGSSLIINLLGVGILLSVSREAVEAKWFAERGVDYAHLNRRWGNRGASLSRNISGT